MRVQAHPSETSIVRVSYHAVTRYCQRVLGVPVLCKEKSVGTLEAALRHARYIGRSVDDIRAEILATPLVIPAMLMRAHAIKTKHFVAAFAGEEVRVVATIKVRGSQLARRMKTRTSNNDKRCRSRKFSRCKDYEN